ncbi:MAG: phosphotransferase [Nitrospinales bacterium]
MKLEPVIKLLSGCSRYAKVDVFPLSGGITNKNFRANLCGNSYVISIGGQSTKHLGIDRKAEFYNMHVAHQFGIGPAVVFQGRNVIIHRFVEGRVLKAREITCKSTQNQFVNLIQRCHRIPVAKVRGHFCVFENVEYLMREGNRLGTRLPENSAWIMYQLSRIKQALSMNPIPTVFCHNDLVPENIICSGEKMVLIDWEYSGSGDRYFDLGMVAYYHQLNDNEVRELLGAYFGKVTDSSLARLNLMHSMSALRDAAWSLVQTAVSSLDFDFVAYGQDRFRQFTRLCKQDAFQEWLNVSAASSVNDILAR